MNDRSKMARTGGEEAAEDRKNEAVEGSRTARGPPEFRANYVRKRGRNAQNLYVNMIAKAILSSPEGRLMLCDIYEFISKNYPEQINRSRAVEQPSVADGGGARVRKHAWKNSVRHNLSSNGCFVKSEKSEFGKCCYWSVLPECREAFSRGDYKNRKPVRRQRTAAKQQQQPKKNKKEGDEKEEKEEEGEEREEEEEEEEAVGMMEADSSVSSAALFPNNSFHDFFATDYDYCSYGGQTTTSQVESNGQTYGHGVPYDGRYERGPFPTGGLGYAHGNHAGNFGNGNCHNNVYRTYQYDASSVGWTDDNFTADYVEGFGTFQPVEGRYQPVQIPRYASLNGGHGAHRTSFHDCQWRLSNSHARMNLNGNAYPNFYR